MVVSPHDKHLSANAMRCQSPTPVNLPTTRDALCRLNHSVVGVCVLGAPAPAHGSASALRRRPSVNAASNAASARNTALRTSTPRAPRSTPSTPPGGRTGKGGELADAADAGIDAREHRNRHGGLAQGAVVDVVNSLPAVTDDLLHDQQGDGHDTSGCRQGNAKRADGQRGQTETHGPALAITPAQARRQRGTNDRAQTIHSKDHAQHARRQTQVARHIDHVAGTGHAHAERNQPFAAIGAGPPRQSVPRSLQPPAPPP